MSEIKALDRLRESSHLDDNKWTLETGEVVHVFCSEQNDPNAVNWGEQWRKIADEIEREIQERYMELPVDADGVPIRVGDLIEFGKKGERLEVTHFGWTKFGESTMAYRRPNGTLDCSCIGDECRHVKPRTLENVLSDCCNEWNQHLGKDWEQGVYAKYAAEIRELMGGDVE